MKTTINLKPAMNGRHNHRESELKQFADKLEAIDLKTSDFQTLEEYDRAKETACLEEVVGKYGLKGLTAADGTATVPCCYDDIFINPKYIAAHYGGKVDFYSFRGTPLRISDEDGRNLLDDLRFHNIYVDVYDDGIVIVSRYSQPHVIDICDITGKVLRAEIMSDYYRYQKDGVAIVGEVENQYLRNLITGKDLTDEYYEIRRFSEGIAIARRFDRRGRPIHVALNMEGKEINNFGPHKEVISNCHEGYVVARDMEDDIMGIMAVNGKCCDSYWNMRTEELFSPHNGLITFKTFDGKLEHSNKEWETID